MAKDKCVLCGNETQYDIETHIDYRIGYIEGAGQLCEKCNNKGSNREMITIPKYFVTDYPNDMELGEVVRRYFIENYGY